MRIHDIWHHLVTLISEPAGIQPTPSLASFRLRHPVTPFTMAPSTPHRVDFFFDYLSVCTIPPCPTDPSETAADLSLVYSPLVGSRLRTWRTSSSATCAPSSRRKGNRSN